MRKLAWILYILLFRLVFLTKIFFLCESSRFNHMFFLFFITFIQFLFSLLTIPYQKLFILYKICHFSISIKRRREHFLDCCTQFLHLFHIWPGCLHKTEILFPNKAGLQPVSKQSAKPYLPPDHRNRKVLPNSQKNKPLLNDLRNLHKTIILQICYIIV